MICRVATRWWFLMMAMATGAGMLGAQTKRLAISVDARGQYAITAQGQVKPVLVSGVAAKVDGQWIHSSDYPRHDVQSTTAEGYWGKAQERQVTFSGLAGKPELLYRIRADDTQPWADIEVTVRNNTGRAFEVQGLRAVESAAEGVAVPGAPSADRVLSDSFSEDRPAMQLRDLGNWKHQMHLAVGSQLIYNRETHASLFLGALSSEHFLTILRLHMAGTSGAPRIARYEVDSTGTTEMELENSLEHSPAVDRVELSLPIAPGLQISSEPLAISTGIDYHQQLETYGSLIHKLHHARVDAPPLMGWWSWTAFYFGLNEAAALTNATWEAEHLKRFGYDIFHIDEGYQYARGEYTTPDAALFPHGLTPLEYKVRGLGLTPGIWTAPFEISQRSAVFQQHPEWLVKNAQGHPIHAGDVVDGKDQLYVLDTTNPGAQEYLRTTYRKLVREWGIHYIKMDFMDDSAIEGYYYKPHTTAMEAQRIGLGIIREAVGDDVFLDKDGSAMLNPVGYVDYGRISQDTGHSFDASREAAPGIAARYYMNRNYFVSDPDAFTVSTQRITDQTWHEGRAALTLDEARVSMALAAVSGGMFEIGDNLPSLQKSEDRVALLGNRDLIDMVRLGKASIPIDLLSYTDADRQPSLFYLKESDRQSVLTVFNWTEQPRKHAVRLADIGLTGGPYTVTEVLSDKALDAASGSLELEQPPHSVLVLKIVDNRLPGTPPEITMDCNDSGSSGDNLSFAAHDAPEHPATAYRWDFGDGVETDGSHAHHAWTEPGDYDVSVTAKGLDDRDSRRSCRVHVSGHLPTKFMPARNQRYEPN
ncbi:MAG TPA: alpha-galactosidase [Acidobacteriaceae bacterium]|jgi:hypothetical protein